MELLIGIIFLFLCNKWLQRRQKTHNTKPKRSCSYETEYSKNIDELQDTHFLDDIKNAEPYENQNITTDIDYAKAYQARYLFSKNEWHQYMKLREIANIKGMVICPKVRLLDIIEPRKGEKSTKLYSIKFRQNMWIF